MKFIQTIVTVTTDGKITVQLPPDISPGEHEVVVVIDEEPLTQEVHEQPLSNKPNTKQKRPPLNFPVHDCGPWPANLSLRREDMYDDWGR